MNFKKSIYIIAVVSLLTPVLSGCGSFAGDVTAATQVTTPTVTQSTQPASTQTATQVITQTPAQTTANTVTQTTTQITTQTTTVEQPVTTKAEIARPEGWTKETHSNNIDPNYEIVFPQDKVNEIKITITPDDWAAMQANMTKLFGVQGTTKPGQLPGAGGVIPRPGVLPPGGLPGIGGGTLPAGGDMTPVNPMWVPATIEFNGLSWTNVGIRYKGNSSLTSGWKSGTLKLPLKLDFDEFEEDYPEINNQRFYGFKQLSLSNAFNDSTYMHDVIAADLLAEAGLVASETAYYEVIMDYGKGPVSLGLYIMIEVTDDTVIDRVFSDDSGNIYEADGNGVSLAKTTTAAQRQNSFKKENNETEADWSDIEALYNVLHSAERISNPVDWRASLESVFDVDTFLEWLGISAIIQNWDNYGSMNHNFYLYHNPETGLLTWISWDHNEVFKSAGQTGGMNRGVSFDKKDVGQNWPLIRFLLDDPVYYDKYLDYLEATINGAYNPEKLGSECRELAALISPYIGQSGKTAFDSAVQQLINNINERYKAAESFLAAAR